MIDLEDALSAAVDAAKAAGEVLRAHAANRGALTVRHKTSARDLVSQADEEAQREIERVLHEAFPSHRIIGEEAGADDIGDPESPYAWAVDPLDGTTNFLRGKPTVGTILALLHESEAVLGLLHRPFIGDTFHAVRGGGAFIDGKPVTLRRTAGMDDAVITMNLRRADRDPIDADGTKLVRVPVCGSVENYGSSVESFVQLLLGHNDGVLYDGPHIWDLAAGCLITEEAGGYARWELRDPADVRGSARCVAASTKDVFDRLSALVFEA